MSIRTPQSTTTSDTASTAGRWNRMVGSIVEAALSPHPVDRYLELLDPMITWRDLRGQIIRVEHPTARTVRLTIRPTRQWQGHAAGQYVQVKVVVDGVRHARCFSPANAAGKDGDIELTITANDDGLVSKHLREHARAGDVVGLEQADGDFVLPETDPTSAVFVSGGSGITPVLSMARTLVSRSYAGPITFVHYARTASDVAYRDELSALAAAHPGFDLRMHYTREEGDGHFEASHLEDVPGLTDADVFVCGPSALMDAVTAAHRELGISQPLHSEAFTLAAPAVDPETVDGELTFSQSGKTASNDGRPILDQAEAAGLTPESGCRMGICFSCTAIKKSGCTRNVRTGELDSESDTQIQLCINAPVGSVDIQI
ncbi:ferredoxin reductase [Gordonia sp. zg691]|uniref:Ferredoxin reductase n=1 Tax=Gordonia jinghuaiqii TaxID=2758710 RepID=A0A7D7QJC0_9ACTN|nr:FAD-binding oxidoreductase [Gordonia jinghuaiqii]MBD0862105.1 ferredoxin reductase [Gordonia jinghuaiqii]MCR5978669.1 ferredoxin reductase [Gordonia jinghuaiqii]QMT02984.1 ferredoxin reductase [Gordonia jinghuaiqii]